MPYIPFAEREQIALGFAPETTGQLTYVIYLACMESLPEKPRFGDYAAVLGCLEAVKLEIARRHLAYYEDMKRSENGDVP